MLLKKYLYTSLVIFSLSPLVLPGQQVSHDLTLFERSPVFKEQFDNNNNNWITDNTWIKGNIEHGFYTITCKNYNNQTGLTFKTILIDQKKDYEIESSVKILRGTGALAFGISKNFDHYRVELTTLKNTITILKNSPQSNKIESLFLCPLKSGINPDISNKITIRKISRSYFVLINDEQICQLKNIEPAGEQIGFSIGLNSEISVDYLNINYLIQKTSPSVAEREDSKIPVQRASAPEITWISPSGMTTSLNSYTAKIKAEVKSVSGLNSVLVYLNGISKGEPDIKNSQDESGVFLIEKTLNFNPGENSVFIIANNIEGSTRSDLRYFKNPAASLPTVKWQNPPDQTSVVATNSFNVEVCINSATDLKSVKILVNGITLTINKRFHYQNGNFLLSLF